MVRYPNRKNLRANKTKLIAAVSLVMAITIMMTSNQLSIFASSTTDGDGNNTEVPYCNEADPGYNGTCFDSQDYDEVTGMAPCKDGSQVQNYKDCPDRQDK